jgi:DNA-binding transcriptional ArsR family regulator
MMTIYEALAEPMRRRILDLLRERPRLVGELVDALGISQPGVSKHLRVLREAGLVRVRQVPSAAGTSFAWSRFRSLITGWTHIASCGKNASIVWMHF